MADVGSQRDAPDDPLEDHRHPRQRGVRHHQHDGMRRHWHLDGGLPGRTPAEAGFTNDTPPYSERFPR